MTQHLPPLPNHLWNEIHKELHSDLYTMLSFGIGLIFMVFFLPDILTWSMDKFSSGDKGHLITLCICIICLITLPFFPIFFAFIRPRKIAQQRYGHLYHVDIQRPELPHTVEKNIQPEHTTLVYNNGKKSLWDILKGLLITFIFFVLLRTCFTFDILDKLARYFIFPGIPLVISYRFIKRNPLKAGFYFIDFKDFANEINEIYRKFDITTSITPATPKTATKIFICIWFLTFCYDVGSICFILMMFLLLSAKLHQFFKSVSTEKSSKDKTQEVLASSQVTKLSPAPKPLQHECAIQRQPLQKTNKAFFVLFCFICCLLYIVFYQQEILVSTLANFVTWMTGTPISTDEYQKLRNTLFSDITTPRLLIIYITLNIILCFVLYIIYLFITSLFKSRSNHIREL